MIPTAKISTKVLKSVNYSEFKTSSFFVCSQVAYFLFISTESGIKYQTTITYSSVRYTTLITQETCLQRCTVLWLLQVTLVQQPPLSSWPFCFITVITEVFSPLCYAPVLLALSSLATRYDLVSSPYLIIIFSFVLHTSPEPATHRCSTGALCRAFKQGVRQFTRH